VKRNEELTQIERRLEKLQDPLLLHAIKSVASSIDTQRKECGGTRIGK